MFTSTQIGDSTSHVVCHVNDKRWNFRQVLQGLADASLATRLTRLIADHPAAAVFWEMPPLTSDRLEDKFECVLVNSTMLDTLPADTVTFNAYFKDGKPVAVFENLGGDATLVAPAPLPTGARYPHLAAFCRTAPQPLTIQFWQCLARTALARIGASPVWISTAGTGVGWLHARLDSRPKYYSHAPYKRWP